VTVKGVKLRLTIFRTCKLQGWQAVSKVKWNRSCCTDLHSYWMQREGYNVDVGVCGCLRGWAPHL